MSLFFNLLKGYKKSSTQVGFFFYTLEQTATQGIKKIDWKVGLFFQPIQGIKKDRQSSRSFLIRQSTSSKLAKREVALDWRATVFYELEWETFEQTPNTPKPYSRFLIMLFISFKS